MRIAVVGGGVSGLVAAYLLQHRHAVTLFEAAAQVGGHARTVPVRLHDRTLDVDLGFMVYNETTYPNFTRLLGRLGVGTRPTVMSFGARCHRSGLEWCGASLSSVFAQPANLLRPSFLLMLCDVLRFNRRAIRWIDAGGEGPTLRELLSRGGYSRNFLDHYLLPMGAAIWSSTPERLLDLPAGFFLRFFRNHGLLSAGGQLSWRTISGGSRRYVEAMLGRFAGVVRTKTPVLRIRRTASGIELTVPGGPVESFDQAVIGAHADQALAMLESPTPVEREILGAFPYQRNEALLHDDERVLPRAPRARASWNYLKPAQPKDRVAVTYDVGRLQGLAAPHPLLVSLNLDEAIAAERILARERFDHPVFSPAGISAQRRHAEISGRDRIHYCGAYWRNGFHEDGVVSGMNVARAFGETFA